MFTKSGESEYKGFKLFAVFEADENGEVTRDVPIVSFGKKKARALYAHLKEFEKWCEEQGFENE